MNITFTKKVNQVGLTCFSRVLNQTWYAGNYLVEDTSFFTDLMPELCEVLTIEVIDFESKELKCKEGTCLGVEKAQVFTSI